MTCQEHFSPFRKILVTHWLGEVKKLTDINQLVLVLTHLRALVGVYKPGGGLLPRRFDSELNESDP